MISTIKQFTFILLSFQFSIPAVYAGTIQGMVKDGETGQPLPGVNIMIVNTVLGTSSQLDGSFRIDNVPAGTYTLRASMIAHHPVHQPVQVPASGTVTLTLTLKETIIDFDPLVVTANKTRQSLDETPNSLSVMQAPEIRERQPLRVDQVLETIPGVHMVREQVNIRGSTGFTIGAANRTLLLVDGVPVMTSDTGQFNWDLLPVLDIRQIEVIKGAGSALWGTAALGGVINIITLSPSEEGRTVVRGTIGQYDEPRYPEWRWTDKPLYFNRLDVSHSQRIGRFGYRLSVGRHVSDGYTEVGDFRRWNATGKFTWQFRNSSTWMFYASYNYNEAGIYVGWDDPQKPFNVRPSNRNSRGKIEMANIYSKLDWLVSPKARLECRISYLMSLMGNQFVTSTDFNPARGLGAEVRANWLPHQSLDITVGSEYKWDTGNTKYFGEHKGYTTGTYSQAEIRLFEGILRLTPGIRYDRYQLIGGLSQSLVSPRFGINYRPWGVTILRASAGTGFRAATIAERYLSFESNSVTVEANPDLQAETAVSVDVGWRQYVTPDWYVEVGAFRSEFENLIEIDLRQSQIEFGRDIRVAVRFQNLQHALIRGMELTTAGHWWKRRLRLQASATIINHEDLTTHQPLTYRPKVIAFINPAIALGRWELHADYRYASRMEAVKLFSFDERVPQKVWNFRLLYHAGPVTMQAAVNNALDYYYTQIERNMAEIRNFTIGFTAVF